MEDRDVAKGGTSKKDSDEGVQQQNEQKQEKALFNQRKDRVLLVADPPVRYVWKTQQNAV